MPSATLSRYLPHHQTLPSPPESCKNEALTVECKCCIPLIDEVTCPPGVVATGSSPAQGGVGRRGEQEGGREGGAEE